MLLIMKLIHKTKCTCATCNAQQ